MPRFSLTDLPPKLRLQAEQQMSPEVAPDGPTEPLPADRPTGQGNRILALTLPYPPSANLYWRTIVHTDKKTGVSRALVFVSTEAKKYKAGIGQLAGTMERFAGPVGMRVRVFRPQRSGDLGNRIKVLEDALEGVAYENDNQIEYLEAFRGDDKDNPRVEVEVWGLSHAQQWSLNL